MNPQSPYPFVEWLDLDANGMLTECAIMNRAPSGDVYYFPLNALDRIDKSRLRKILKNRNTQLHDQLWKVLEQHTLGNGANALEFFNQLVKHKTTNGHILPFGSNQQAAYTPQQASTQAPFQAPEVAPEVAPSFDAVAKPTKTK